MRVFATKGFVRFAKDERISEDLLCEAVERATGGLVDADLGGGVIKQRIARPGGGRSGGYRTLIAFRAEERAVFLYGFGKNERDNISREELRQLRIAAAEVLAWNFAEVASLVAEGKWKEIECDG